VLNGEDDEGTLFRGKGEEIGGVIFNTPVKIISIRRKFLGIGGIRRSKLITRR